MKLIHKEGYRIILTTIVILLVLNYAIADDVACSHGCTIGQLDDEALFYLRSRGIPFKEAQAMLMYAFANDVLSNVKIPELKEKLNRIIAEKLGVELNIEV